MKDKNLDIVKEIISWPSVHDDDTKLYFIQSYLLGWTSEQAIHDITARAGV